MTQYQIQIEIEVESGLATAGIRSVLEQSLHHLDQNPYITITEANEE